MTVLATISKTLGIAGWVLLWVALLPFTLVESALVLLTIALMFADPYFANEFRTRVAVAAGRLARRKRIVILICGLLPLFVRAALLPLMPIPDPVVHDEFSYLLAGDTFASGRVANPTHEMWPYFETPHVNHIPTYGSKYPPGQGIALAVGQVAFGHPWYGVWLSVGLMCGAVCWALQQWLPAGWAFYGGVLLALRLGITGYWMNSYWGGAVAAIGGALVIGAFPRIRRRPRWTDAVVLGVGLCVLANTRPFEGLIASLPLAIVLTLDFVRTKRSRRIQWFTSVVTPVMLVGFSGLAGMAYYNWRTTGDLAKMPYQVNREMYGVVPLVFAFGQAPPPEPFYHQASVRDFYAGWEAEMFETMQSFPGLVRRRVYQGLRVWNFFGGPLLALPLFFAPWVVRDRRTRILVVTVASFVLTLGFVVWIMPHYLAPILAPAWVLTIQATRRMNCWSSSGRPTGRIFSHAIPVVAILSIAACLFDVRLNQTGRALFSETSPCVCWRNHPMSERARLARELEQSGGKHLVLVRYGSEHIVHEEWVHNKASIDDAPVVWAHHAVSNDLVEHFSDRTLWVLDADIRPVTLKTYRRSAGPGDAAANP